MLEGKVEDFIKSISTNDEIKKEVMDAVSSFSPEELETDSGKAKYAEAIMEIASKHGFDFTEDELVQYIQGNFAVKEDGELSDDMLEMAAGGKKAKAGVLGTLAGLGTSVSVTMVICIPLGVLDDDKREQKQMP